jgi:hypothetical protein
MPLDTAILLNPTTDLAAASEGGAAADAPLGLLEAAGPC